MRQALPVQAAKVRRLIQDNKDISSHIYIDAGAVLTCDRETAPF